MSRRAIAGLVVLLLVLVVALGWGGWWWTHPSVLSAQSMGLGSGSTHPEPVADAIWNVGVAGDPWSAPGHGETLTFHGYHPHFSTDGAAVKVLVSVCTARPGVHSNVIGAVTGDLGQYCTAVRPLRNGTTMRTGTSDYLVATITPTRPGTSTLTSIGIDYSRSARHLWQRGTDDVKGGFTLIATGPDTADQ